MHWRWIPVVSRSSRRLGQSLACCFYWPPDCPDKRIKVRTLLSVHFAKVRRANPAYLWNNCLTTTIENNKRPRCSQVPGSSVINISKIIPLLRLVLLWEQRRIVWMLSCRH
ncbi:hypothetical protein T265_15915, partial [Opisthorchis viverrini]